MYDQQFIEAKHRLIFVGVLKRLMSRRRLKCWPAKIGYYSMMSLSSTQSLTLDEPPSCIAFWPTDPKYFVVGTYVLHKSDDPSADEATQHRSGSLVLWSLENDKLTQHTATATHDHAILDLQWSPHTYLSKHLLAVATSTGLLIIWHLEIDLSTNSPALVQIASYRVGDPSILVLYLQWHPFHDNVIGVTLSDGRVLWCESTRQPWQPTSTIETHEIGNHGLEAWCLAFHDETIFSSGDDAILQRIVKDESQLPSFTTLWQDRRTHQAGVTYILPLDADHILTGSYDDCIRLIRVPPSGKRQVLAEENLGGGVWRIQVLEKSKQGSISNSEGLGTNSMLLLVSCMYAGTRIVQLQGSASEDGSWSFRVLGRFEEHESMNYASDASSTYTEDHAIVSTSFYDRRICLWKFPKLSAGRTRGE